MRVFVVAFLILVFSGGWMLGNHYGHWDALQRVGIKNWSPRIPYKQFFEEERKTNSPINTVYIKNWILYVETVDGNFDIIPLDIEYRK